MSLRFHSSTRRSSMLRRLKKFTRKLRAGADASIQTERLLTQLLQVQLNRDVTDTLRFKDPLRLLSSGRKVFSQNEEDGMITELFRRIGVTSRRFMEFGVEDGLESNSTFLLIQGWSGAWIEASTTSAAS